MKKSFAFVAALAMSFMCLNAFAQEIEAAEDYSFEQPVVKESFLFNHWSIGAGFGTDGIRFMAATSVTPHVQLRASFLTLGPVVNIGDKVLSSKTEYSLKPFKYTAENLNINQNGIQVDKAQVEGSMQSNKLELLVDLFPSRDYSFHFTVGAQLALSPELVSATGTLMKADGSNSLSPSDYGSTQVMGITSNMDGQLEAAVKFGTKFRPYVGIGFGRPVTMNHRVNLNFDLGVAYIGGVHAVVNNYYDVAMGQGGVKEVELNEAWVKSDPDVSKNVNDDAIKWLNFANNFPVMPIVRFTIVVRLF